MNRSEAYFGLHFDFHAESGEVVPSIFRPEAFEAVLDVVKPDYIQCDTKGHPGISSYPTKVGTPPENCPHDVLKTLRSITKERGISLYGHHSSVYDAKVCADHPQWEAILPSGEPNGKFLSVFSPYADEILIPQLKELAGEYGLDGVWLDGDCWGARVDYSIWAVSAYKAKYGAEPPRPEDENYEHYREFCRQGFLDYVNHYITEVHAEYPDFEIISNWIYSRSMPFPITLPVCCLSGDLDSRDALSGGRIHGRVYEARGLSWDLMGWGFNLQPEKANFTGHNHTLKGRDQHLQEAASVLMLGGGYQVYNLQYGSGGTVQDWAIPIWKDTAEFCRERTICHKGRLLSQVGVLLPNQPNPVSVDNCFSLNDSARSFNAWICLLQESGLSCSAVFEHDDFSRFPVLVAPNSDAYSPEAMAKLTAYVQRGGRLIIDGGSTEHLQALTGIVKKSEEENRLVFLEGDGRLAAARIPFKEFEAVGAQAVSLCYTENIFEAPSLPSAYLHSVGAGKVCTLTFPMKPFYDFNRAASLYSFVRKLMDAVEYVPYVSVSGSNYAEHTILLKEDCILVNLLNRAGEHQVSAVRCYDEVPSIGPLTVTIRDKAVKSLTQIPENVNLPMTPTEDGFQVTIDRLHIHTILKLEK
ncbi:MAG: hypothetical protein IJW41_00405 [Oscillospiraceae bacterium]|nr:hypothetical protein [Oscillospiraceae bacterium]